jgi:hypothetical protein
MFQHGITHAVVGNETFQQRLTDIENFITTTDSNNNIYSTLTQLQQDKNEFRTWCNNNQPTNVNTKVETLHKILRHVLITPLTPTNIMRISISMLKESLHYYNDPLAKTLMINTIFRDTELINIIIQSLNKGITSNDDNHITLAVETVLLIATTCKTVALSNSVERESIFTLLNNIGLFKLVRDFAFHLQEKVPVQQQEQEQASSFQIVTHCLQYIVRYLVGFAHEHQYNIAQPPTKSLLILNGMMRNGLIEAYFKLPPMFRHMHEDEESTLIGEVEIYTPQESAKFVYEIVLLLNDQSINNEGEEKEFSYKSIHRASIGKFIYNCLASLRDIDEWFGDVVADYEVVAVYSLMIITLMYRGLGGEQENIDALYFAGSAIMDMEGGKALVNDILQHLREIEGWSGDGYSDDELDEDEQDDEGHTLGAFHQNWSWATLLVDNPENTTNSTFLTDKETLPRLEACRKAWEDDHHGAEGIFKTDIKWLITSGTMTISILRECMKAGLLSQQMEGQRIKRANIVA